MISFLQNDEKIWYVRKPAGLPCTFGQEKSFLEMCVEGGALERAYLENYGQKQMEKYIILPEPLKEGLALPAEGTREVFAKQQQSLFSRDEEWGLVNRLDTATAGYVYMVKTRDLYKKRSDMQQQEQISKSYTALVHGDVRYMFKDESSLADIQIDKDKHQIRVGLGIGHHLHLDDRMVVAGGEADKKNIRGGVQAARTQLRRLEYSEKDNMTLLSVNITKGLRHQIRAHLGYLGYPIVGDRLYGKRHFDKLRSHTAAKGGSAKAGGSEDLLLHLRSMGCEII